MSDKINSIYDVFLGRYKKFTAIQKVAIPIISDGNNCVIVAPTGSGKTEAAVLPVIDYIKKSGDFSGIKVVYITPLRALNRDMIKRLEWICDAAKIKVAVRHGDTDASERRKQAKAAPTILITTPETLQSILPTKSFRVHLKGVNFVIIDEIHELYSNKRGAQLSIALERLASLSPNFKRIGISATVASPDLIGRFMCNDQGFKIAAVDLDKKIKVDIEVPKSYEGDMGDVPERFGLDEKATARLGSISNHISKAKSSLIFANTRQVVEALGSRLVYMDKIHSFGGIGVHHSSLDKRERIDMENKFKDNIIRNIIATSSLELGIDIGKIDLVIQYGSPRQALRLAQRVGRSGHSEAEMSRGVIVAIDEMDAIESVAIYKNLKSRNLETFAVHENAMDVLCQQVCGIALDMQICNIDGINSIVKRSFVYREFGKDELQRLLNFMSAQHLIGFDGYNITSGMRTRMYYYDHLSVIPDTTRLMVKNIVDNRTISTLDERFVASSVEEGGVFIVKGLPWRVISIDERTISVEPSNDLEAAVPDWTGEDIPVSYGVAQGVLKILNDAEMLKELKCMNDEDYKILESFVNRQREYGVFEGSTLLIERTDEYIILHTALGTMANEALARLVVHLVAFKVGKSINVKVSPYFIYIELGHPEVILAIVKAVNTANIERLIEDAVRETELFRYRFITVAKLFGVIERGATVSKSLAKRIIKVLRDTPVYKETMRELLKNYFDIGNVTDFLTGLQSGKIKVREVVDRDLSPMANAVLNAAYYTKELIMPLMPNRELIDSFSSFLLNKEIKLICTYCGFVFTRKVATIKDMDHIECPSCKSPMVSRYNEDYPAVIKKFKSEKKMSLHERRLLDGMIREASLFDSYGGRAAVALSTYGIGPKFAARALLMHRQEERLFYTDLIEAQKQFIRTKKYWSLR